MSTAFSTSLSVTVPQRQPLKPFEQALAELLTHAAPLQRTETVSTFDADGRVLVQNLTASLDVPANDNSSMDGYAVRCADWVDTNTLLPVSQRIPAGSSGHLLAPNSVARIFTGAPIPPGADAVVMQEECVALDAGVEAASPALIGA